MFRVDHSTTLQLLKLTDQLCSNANKNEKTVAVFLDMEKAFDRVWHEGPIYKLSEIGTPYNIVKIIQSFLLSRSFRVRQDGILSSCKPTLSGVLQGSCLSPSLYSIYTNDIPINPNTHLALSANDTLLFSNDKNPKRAIIYLQKQVNIALQ